MIGNFSGSARRFATAYPTNCTPYDPRRSPIPIGPPNRRGVVEQDDGRATFPPSGHPGILSYRYRTRRMGFRPFRPFRTALNSVAVSDGRPMAGVSAISASVMPIGRPSAGRPLPGSCNSRNFRKRYANGWWLGVAGVGRKIARARIVVTRNSLPPHGGSEIHVRRGHVQRHRAVALREIVDASEHDADPVEGLGMTYATTLLRNVKDKTCAMAAFRASKIIDPGERRVGGGPQGKANMKKTQGTNRKRRSRGRAPQSKSTALRHCAGRKLSGTRPSQGRNTGSKSRRARQALRKAPQINEPLGLGLFPGKGANNPHGLERPKWELSNS